MDCRGIVDRAGDHEGGGLRNCNTAEIPSYLVPQRSPALNRAYLSQNA